MKFTIEIYRITENGEWDREMGREAGIEGKEQKKMSTKTDER